MNDRSASWAAPAIPATYLGGAVLSLLFAATSFLSSALVFTVEPMFAKMILPLLGGTPAVWNTCVVFFQAALLAGYGYAHLVTSRLTIRQQALVHALLLLLAFFALPVRLPDGWTPPVESTPIAWLVLVLLVGLGAPFVMVSATAPLMQKWFAATDHPSAHDPYFLYSASNVGSLLALLAYPLAIEPGLPLSAQSQMWTVGYAAFAVLATGCAAAGALRAAPVVAARDREESGDRSNASVSWILRGSWVALAFVPSSLLLGVTTYLSTDIASVPLLWTMPLALYLLSFVLAFASTPAVLRAIVVRAMPLLVSALLLFVGTGVSEPILLVIPLHLVTFVVCSLHLHTQLAQRRPGTRHLTEFYLWIAAGGVLGGFFNTFLAPVLFTGIVEYPAALVAACLLQGWRHESANRRILRADIVLPVAVGGATALLTYGVSTQITQSSIAIALLAPLAIWCFSFSARPTRFALALAMMLVAMNVSQPQAHGHLVADRTFFGVLRVRAKSPGPRHVLTHGNTIHGEQNLDFANRGEPLTYYHRSGPIGQLMRTLAPRLDGARIGVVGLGAGSMAAYTRPGQHWTFYEIDPAVVRIAREPSLFTYLHDCGARCEVVLGDARLSLARTDATYRLLVLDAFSSDAIPVHLLTREAFDLYLRRLEPHGVLAVHISNRHLRLEPVLAALAREKGLAAAIRRDAGAADTDKGGAFPSEWVLMARSPEVLAAIVADPAWQPPAVSAGTRLWTDDYSDILAVLGSE
jgi:hypothetical protein